MRNIIAAAAACLALSANAGDHDQMVWHGSGGSVYLMQEACAIPALAELLKDAGAKAIRTAVVKHGAVEVPACWGLFEDEGELKVLIGDVFGQGGYLPAKSFKPQPTI